jgi:hypothetical protein
MEASPGFGLQVGFGVFGQNRARDTLQGDVHAVREILEAFRQVGQPELVADR